MRVLLLLAVGVVTALAYNSYVVISPAKVRANMDLAISVNILKATSDVTVTADLMRWTTSVASGSGIFQAGKPGTINIKLPAVLPNAGYKLKVQGSGGLTFSRDKSLTINKKELSVFIQSDKAIYKPGDTVNFRMFATYSDLKSYTGPMDIYIFDGQANKIKQWLGEIPVNGVITKKLALSSQPVLGDWKISVQTSQGTTEEKVFTVDEYVLPKFEVDVIMPSYALTSDSDVTFTVKSKYTYGKPVKGTADVVMKLHYSYHQYDYSRDLPVTTTQVPIDGEAKVKIPMSAVKAITNSLNKHYLVVTANVTESLTGNAMTANGTVQLYDKSVKLDFIDSNPETFKPGLQYIAYLKVSQPDGMPISSTTDKVTISTRLTIEGKGITPTPYYYYQSPTSSKTLPDVTYDVPSNGMVAVPVNIDSDAKQATVTAKFQGVNAQLKLDKSYSPSSSYIQLSLESQNINAGDSIQFKVKGTQPLTSLVYQVLSRGGIVKAGTTDANGQTEHSFSVASDSGMAPNARIVVYYVRADGEIVTDSISFDISGAFVNKVSINLDRTDAEPGDKVKVTVQADPSSTAHLLAIDQSVLLLKSGNDVTAEDVYSDLKAYDTIDAKSNNFNFDPCPMCRRKKRMIFWPWPTYYGGSDATQIFQNAGVKVITDALVFKHVEPIPIDYFMDLDFAVPAAVGAGGMTNGVGQSVSSPTDLQEPERVRSNFAETWLWTDAMTGYNFGLQRAA